MTSRKDMMIQRVHLLSWFGLLVLCPPLISASCFTCGSNATVLSHWTNNFSAKFSIPITSEVSGGWKVALKFSKPVIDVQIWNADVESTNSKMTLYILKNKHWNAHLLPGNILRMFFNAMFVEPKPEFTVRLIGQIDCGTCAGDPDEPDKATPTPDTLTLPTWEDATSALPSSTSSAPPKPDDPTSAPPSNEATPNLPDNTPTAPPIFDCPATEVKYAWQGGFRGKFWIPIQNEVVGGWTVRLDFPQEILYLEPFGVDIARVSNNRTTFFLKNKDCNASLAAGTLMIEQFRASVETTPTPTFTAVMIGQPSCAPSTTPSYDDSQNFARQEKRRQVISMRQRGLGKHPRIKDQH